MCEYMIEMAQRMIKAQPRMMAGNGYSPGVVDFGSGSLGSFAQVDETIEGVHSKQKSSNRRVLSKKEDAAVSAVKPSWYGRSRNKRSAHSHVNGNVKLSSSFKPSFIESGSRAKTRKGGKKKGKSGKNDKNESPVAKAFKNGVKKVKELVKKK